MNKPLISIIVPVYNSQTYLSACLDSILAQTYSCYQIIIVNDCSSDNSIDIIENYKKKSKNVILINHDQNQGIGGARNTGLKVAEGDYITYIDSDDEVSSNYCEELINLIGSADIAVAGRATFVNGIYTKSKTASRVEYVDNITAIKYQLQGIYSSHPAWGKLYKRKVAYCIPFEEQYVFEDIRYSLETYLHSQKVVFSDKDMYMYKMHPNTVMTSNGNRQMEGHTYAAQYVYKRLNEEGLYKECESAFKMFLARAIARNTREFSRDHIDLETFKKFSPILVEMFEK